MKTQNIDLGGTEFLTVSQEGTVAVPDSGVLLNSDYARQGNDLHLETSDGSHVVVANYFSHATPPTLISADGQTLSGETVALLAGPRAPGQYAEGVSGQFGEPIGQVETLAGSATAQRGDGITVELSTGDPVFKGDVVSAGDGATVGITFLDKTVFTISDGATMVLNEMVYDPSGSSNSMLFNLIGGTAAFVAGAVAKSGDMKIETPVAVMAIRGTTPFAACGAGPDGCVFGGEEGVYNLLHKIGGQILATVSDPAIVVKLDGVNGAPVVSSPDPVTQAIMQNIFGALRDTVDRLEQRTENGEALIRNAGTGSPDFSDGGLIESIAGFFKSALSTLLDEGQLVTDTEPKSSLAELMPVIDPPLVVATDEDTSFRIEVITEDDILTFGSDIAVVAAIITSGLGTTQISGDARAIIYDPGVNYNALSVGDSAKVTISILVDQGNGTTRTETAIVTVIGVNDDPDANDDTATGNENAIIQVDVLDNDTDPDASDTLEVTSASLVSGQGTVAISADGTRVIYDPAGAYQSLAKGETAEVTISYTISDGAGGHDTATVTITVFGRNDGPTANADFARTGEHQALVLDVLDNDSDTDTSDELVVTSATAPPGHGVASVAADGRSVLFEPGQDFNSLAAGEIAVVRISYEISDGNGGTSTATATVRVVGTNDAPVALPDVAQTSEDSVVVIDVLANDSDVDASDILTISQASVSSGTGTVSIAGDGKSLTYDPAGSYEQLAAGETAPVEITYTISDGQGGFSTSTVAVTVNGVNDAPDAVRDTAVTDEDTDVVIDSLANDTDIDASDALSVTSASILSGLGTVSVAANGQSITYDPGNAYQYLAVGESELVTIRYEISDGNGGTDVARALVTVTGVNDAPQANNDSATTDQVTAVVIDPLANDTDTDTSDALSITSASIITGLGTIRVSADGSLLVYDPGDAYTDLPVGETVTVRASYTISDGNGGTSSATVSIVVGGNNDTPTANPDVATTTQDSAVSIDVLANDTDPDSDPLSITGATIVNGEGSVSVSDNGLLVNYDPGIAYTALAVGEAEDVIISYTISDGNGGTSQSTATVTVTGLNDTPNAVVDTAETTERAPLAVSVLDNDSDPDTSDNLSVSKVSIASGLGSVAISADGQQVLYDPGDAYNSLAKGETAQVIIKYTVDDGNGGTDNARLFLTIKGQNDAPTARDDSAITDEDISVVVAALGNDTDPDTTDTLQIISVSVIEGLGSASIAADGLSLTYDPAGDYNNLSAGTSATVRLSYTISDGNGGTSQAEVTIRVDGVNDGPTAHNDTDSTDEDTSVVIPVLANDTDPDADDDLSVTAANIIEGLGTVSLSADGLSVIYDPNGAYESLAVGETALVRIRYTISDGQGGQDNAIIEVTVNGVNDAPVAFDDAASTDEESTVSIAVIANDTDIDTSDVLSVISASVPAGMGSVSIDPGGTSVSFDPGADFQYLPAGQTTTVDITYTVSDGNGGTDIGTAKVTITGVNDAAVIGGDKTGDVTERDETDTTGGTLTISDIDDGEESFIASVQTGIYGTLALAATGVWLYTLDNADPDTIALSFDESATDVFTISSLDGTTEEIIITVNGAGFDFEYSDFGGNSGSSQFKSIDSGTIEAAQIDLIITPMPLLLDGGIENTVNATQTDLGIGTGQTISEDEGVRMEIVTGASNGNQNDISGFTYDTHVAVQTFKTGIVQVQGDQSQSATVQVRIVFADDDSNFDTQNDAGDVVVALTPGDITITKATGNLLTAEAFQVGDSVVISGLQEGDILTVTSSQVFNRVEIENASDEISPLTSVAFGGNDFEIGVLGFNMPDELLLIGDAGNNVLTGGESNDTLDGRGGQDLLEGGGGVDIFVLGADLSTGGLADIIVDYQQGVDVIDVTALFDLATGAFTEAALQEYVRYISPSDNDADDPAGSVGDVYIDLNGSAGGENFVLAAHISTTPDSVVFKVDDGNQTDYVTII